MLVRLLTGLAIAIVSACIGQAHATCAYTNTFVSGTAILAAGVNQNFNDTNNCFVAIAGGTLTGGNLAGTTLISGGAITSAGSLGIGTTSPNYLLDIRNSTAVGQLHLSGTGNDEGGYILGFGTDGLFLSGGGEYNGTSWIAKASSSSQVAMSGGAINFYNNTGLTPGGAYTRNQSMAITSTGSVGIGTASPGQKFDVLGYGTEVGADWSGTGAGIARTNATTKGGYLAVPHYTNAQSTMGVVMGYSSSGANEVMIGGGTSNVTAATAIEFLTGATSTTLTGTERMRIDSAGKVAIGNTTANHLLDVNGNIGVKASGYLNFGATDGSSGYGIRDNGGTIQLSNSGGSWANIATSSDVRLKKQIADLPSEEGLAAIIKMRPVQFRWKDVKLDREQGQQIGFIAQEVERVLPHGVTGNFGDVTIDLGDGRKEAVKQARSFQYGQLIAPIVKAVQEIYETSQTVNGEIARLKEENRLLKEAICQMGSKVAFCDASQFAAR